MQGRGEASAETGDISKALIRHKLNWKHRSSYTRYMRARKGMNHFDYYMAVATP